MEEEKKLSRVINKIFSKNESSENREEKILSKELVINLLVNGIANLERGLKVLDKNLIITKEPVDVLALDLLGELVIIELEMENNEVIILRALAHFDWFLNNINSIVHKYNKEKIDITMAPRIILVSRNFSEDFLKKLTYVNTTKIDLYEYELKTEDGITRLEFRPHVFNLTENKVIEINKPRLEDLMNFIRNGPLRQSCHKIIKDIRNSHRDVIVDTSSGYIEIKKNGTSLLRIYTQPNFFWINLNPKGKWQGIKVENEKQAEAILEQLKKDV